MFQVVAVVAEISQKPGTTLNVTGDVGITGGVVDIGTIDAGAQIGISGGTVAVSTIDGGNIDVGTIEGDVTVNGNVDVGNTVDTADQITYTALKTSSSQGSGTSFTLSDLHVYKSLLVVCQLVIPGGASGASYDQYAEIDIDTYADVAHTIQIGNGSFFQQQTIGDTAHAQTFGDLTVTRFPLNGADEAVFGFTSVVGTTTGTQIVTVYGVTGALDLGHRTQKFVPPLMFGTPGANLSVTSAAQVQIPIPVTSNPVTVYAFLSGSSTSGSVPTIAIEDSHTSAQPFVETAVPIHTSIMWKLPHSLNPQYVRLQETVSGQTSAWQILITEDSVAM